MKESGNKKQSVVKKEPRKKTCIQGVGHRVEPYSLVVQDSLSGYAPTPISEMFVAQNINSRINQECNFCTTQLRHTT